MAQEPLANEGNFLHIYDFRHNPMHMSPAQVKDGVLCRDVEDPDRFYLIGEWRSIEEHKAIRKQVAEQFKAERGFVSLIEGGKFIPQYAQVVSATPAEYLRGGR